MNSSMVILVAVCMWVGVQFATAVPQHDFAVTHTPRAEMDQISGRFMTFTISKITKTSRVTSTLTSLAYTTCTRTAGAAIAMCPTTRMRRALPFASTQTAQSDTSYVSGSHLMSNGSRQEPDVEVGYMLLPSYIDKDCFTPRGRFLFNWVTVQSTTTLTSTMTTTSSVMGTTVSLTITGCFPANVAGVPRCPS